MPSKSGRMECKMEDTYKIRKDKVKNIAIIFLSIMLVLTFFSNSILNRALPEVATQYVEYGSITERVRGNGVVTAEDPYNVVVKDSRVIQSVAVAKGDMVTKDQVLFYLEESESEEVKQLEDELSDMIFAYTTAILSGDVSNTAYHNIQNGDIASVAAYQAQIEAARQKVKNEQANIKSLEKQKAILESSSNAEIDRETKLALAEVEAARAKERMDEAERRVGELQEQLNTLSGNGDLNAQITAAAMAVGTAKSEYVNAKKELFAELNVFPGGGSIRESNYFKADDMPIDNAQIDALSAKIAEVIKAAPNNDTGVSNNEITGSELVLTKLAAMQNTYAAYLNAENERNKLEMAVTNYPSIASKLSGAKNDYANASSEYSTCQSQVEKLKKESAEVEGSESVQLSSLNLKLADANMALELAREEQTQLLTDVSKELDLSNQNSKIAEKQDELEELREEATEGVIVAPVDGTIISINKVAGETTTPEEAVATIQIAGKGMTVSFSVTNAQAEKVSVGDKAELQNAWYYDDVMVTLNKIKPDTEEPGKKKLLEFTVEGSVQSGENLSLAVGERTAEYDHVVPNSAVREDNKGKFILIIEEKSTPFGNRYKAKRVDVEVLASDETKTAVTAELEGYEYVITTSNQPVSAGDQVRLAEY